MGKKAKNASLEQKKESSERNPGNALHPVPKISKHSIFDVQKKESEGDNDLRGNAMEVSVQEKIEIHEFDGTPNDGESRLDNDELDVVIADQENENSNGSAADQKSPDQHHALENCGQEIHSKTEEELGGVIFLCNMKTGPDIFRYMVMGFPETRLDLVKRIKTDLKLFLYDYHSRLLHGIFRAASPGGFRLEPTAFNGFFPAQVRFKIEKECPPLPFNILSELLETFDARTNMVKAELTREQVVKLTGLFVLNTLNSRESSLNHGGIAGASSLMPPRMIAPGQMPHQHLGALPISYPHPPNLNLRPPGPEYVPCLPRPQEYVPCPPRPPGPEYVPYPPRPLGPENVPCLPIPGHVPQLIAAPFSNHASGETNHLGQKLVGPPILPVPSVTGMPAFITENQFLTRASNLRPPVHLGVTGHHVQKLVGPQIPPLVSGFGMPAFSSMSQSLIPAPNLQPPVNLHETNHLGQSLVRPAPVIPRFSGTGMPAFSSESQFHIQASNLQPPVQMPKLQDSTDGSKSHGSLFSMETATIHRQVPSASLKQVGLHADGRQPGLSTAVSTSMPISHKYSFELNPEIGRLSSQHKELASSCQVSNDGRTHLSQHHSPLSGLLPISDSLAPASNSGHGNIDHDNNREMGLRNLHTDKSGMNIFDKLQSQAVDGVKSSDLSKKQQQKGVADTDCLPVSSRYSFDGPSVKYR